MTQTELTSTASLTGKWKTYPAYKDSGVEWLGEIPEHWEVKRLRFICHVNPSKTALSYLPIDTPISFLPMEQIGVDGSISLEETRTIEQVRQGYTCFRNGDVIVAKITPCFENGKGALCTQLLNGIGFGTTELHVLRAKDETDPKFIFYLTRSKPFCEIGTAMMYGSAGQQRVPEDFINDFQVGFPSLTEQRAIATFLDHETTRINALIAKKERLIELLQEKRAALISLAVTKGLDPTVRMKDSGVEWLGEIPEHWEVLHLKRIAKIRYGLGQPPAQLDEGTPFIRATNVKSGVIVDEGMLYVDCSDIPQSRDAVLSSGEIIVVRSGAYTGDSAIVPKKFQGTIAGYDMVVAVTIGYSPFIAWQLLSSEVRELQFNFHSQRAAQPHLNAEELGDTLFSVPPSTEQHAIANYLDRETAKSDALVSRIREGIEKLREYSAALISAAVTGKIDVRGEIAS